jgi:hypothetical protein
MRPSRSLLGLTVLSLGLLFACGTQDEPQKSRKPATQQTAPAKPEAARHDPAAKKHDQEENVKLQTYDEPGMAIRTEYPDTMTVEGAGSGEGSGFIFTFKPRGNALDQAKVHIFLPRGAATAAAQEPFVAGPGGLLENNGWEKADATDDTPRFPYGWVRKSISFADPGNHGMKGEILLGEGSGQAVQVILYYPNDRDKEFLADAHVILKNLHFKSDDLPLKKPH